MIGDTFVGAYTMWDEAGDDDANFAWLKGASARMRPLAVGQYINEVDGFRDPSVLQRCFSRQAWPRLATLRRKYDPHGVFAPWPGTG
jgi:FAD/FMN-containing dehydrogenase